MGLLAKASVAIDGSKFKAVNSRDNNFTKGKMERRRPLQIERVAGAAFEPQLTPPTARCFRCEACRGAAPPRLAEKLIKLEEEVKRLKAD